MQHKKLLLLFTLLIASMQNFAQYSHADTLRGTNGMGRRWWNITKYDMLVEPNIAEQTISGTVTITFNLPADYNGQPMQIDLQEPMHIDKIRLKGFSEREQSDITMQREGNVYWINGLRNLNYIGNQIELQLSGKPVNEGSFKPFELKFVVTVATGKNIDTLQSRPSVNENQQGTTIGLAQPLIWLGILLLSGGILVFLVQTMKKNN
jgi:hypothetical protein